MVGTVAWTRPHGLACSGWSAPGTLWPLTTSINTGGAARGQSLFPSFPPSHPRCARAQGREEVLGASRQLALSSTVLQGPAFWKSPRCALPDPLGLRASAPGAEAGPRCGTRGGTEPSACFLPGQVESGPRQSRSAGWKDAGHVPDHVSVMYLGASLSESHLEDKAQMGQGEEVRARTPDPVQVTHPGNGTPPCSPTVDS